MHPPALWDWESGQRVILASMERPEGVAWVEEFHASPDGERVAALASLEEGGFTALVNGEQWENPFDKAWYPRFSPDGRFTAVVQQDGMWTLAVDGEPWEESFDYLWGTQFSAGGEVIAACVQSGGEYGLCIDGAPWETLYENANQCVLSADGKSAAAVVQLESLKPADLEAFQKGVFGVAVNGQSWDARFMNCWTPAFDAQGQHVAAQVRLSLYDYSIAVDGKLWGENYACVWEPRFNPATGKVAAPVRVKGLWGMAQDGQIIWEPRFMQCWHQQFSPDGKSMAAIVAPEFGAFTVAVNGKPWGARFPVVTDLVVGRDGASDGACVAALGCVDNADWQVMVDGGIWPGTWDMAWTPVVSPAGGHVAVKVAKGDRQTRVVDGRVFQREFDKVFEPAFSPDGRKLLIRGIDKGTALRIVADVGQA
ncbi:MAG: PD40 domain-containing protein [Desulfovibrio sp.]|nr:PD40 domain-containing protein [Desulfovibrio sp.]